MLGRGLKSNKRDILILIIISIFAYITFFLNIIYRNKGIIYALFQYIALPIFWIGVIYVSLHSYFTILTEKGRPSGKIAVVMFLSYVSMMIILYVIIIMIMSPYLSNIAKVVNGAFLFPVSLYVLFVISYGISFLLIFALSAIAELITYVIISRVNAPFITRGSNYLAVWLFGYPNYGGMAFGGVYKGFVIIRSMSDEVNEVGRGILVHEVQHVRGKHVPLILSLAFTVPVYLYLLLTSGVTSSFFVDFILPFMVLMPLVLFRACEVNADRAMFKVYGSDALNYILTVLKSTYGVSSTEKAPWSSRSTHTGRRDLVLKYGDAIAPHAVWEFPLLLSLLTASIITIAYVSYAILLINNMDLIEYLASLTYVASMLGSMVLTMLLGLILRPIARLFLTNTLTERGLLNISTLTAGLYLAVMGFAFYGVNQYLLIALFLSIMLLIISYYAGFSTKSLIYLVFSFAVLFVISLAIHYILILMVHYMRVLPIMSG
ncbi:hypothetical protein [Vulcanisaeta distributa]|uniref:hypothetical protein n=1 Tax=Vulcanisaeta distributa TaxID=164451 RepID=UPI000A911C3C|nr:hypothetical protein [Vulcanisaeta distributa]